MKQIVFTKEGWWVWRIGAHQAWPGDRSGPYRYRWMAVVKSWWK